MVKRYKEKPRTIEAIQLTRENLEKCIEFTKNNLRSVQIPRHPNGVMTGEIDTLYTIRELDFIIKDEYGEFRPCSPDIFKRTYEAIR